MLKSRSTMKWRPEIQHYQEEWNKKTRIHQPFIYNLHRRILRTYAKSCLLKHKKKSLLLHPDLGPAVWCIVSTQVELKNFMSLVPSMISHLFTIIDKSPWTMNTPYAIECEEKLTNTPTQKHVEQAVSNSNNWLIPSLQHVWGMKCHLA